MIRVNNRIIAARGLNSATKLRAVNTALKKESITGRKEPIPYRSDMAHRRYPSQNNVGGYPQSTYKNEENITTETSEVVLDPKAETMADKKKNIMIVLVTAVTFVLIVFFINKTSK